MKHLSIEDGDGVDKICIAHIHLKVAVLPLVFDWMFGSLVVVMVLEVTGVVEEEDVEEQRFLNSPS